MPGVADCPLHPSAASVSLALALSGCGACGNESSQAIRDESRRLWGRELLASKIAEQAAEPIEAGALSTDRASRDRVLRMSIDEVVGRLGFLVYSGTARFVLERNGHTVEVEERTLLEHGLGGGWRVLQKDASGTILREKVFSNGIYYVRNGPGQLRAQGVADAPGGLTKDEAFEPLETFTGYFGERLDLERVGTTLAQGRAAVEYRFGLREATPSGDRVDERIGDPNRPASVFRPLRLSGRLLVDTETGAPLGSTLRGELEVEPTEDAATSPSRAPGAPARDQKGALTSPGSDPNATSLGGSGAFGRLEVALDFEVKPVEGRAIVPSKHVPEITRREVDLDPLGFLRGETRTSTVIGGQRRSASRDP